MSTSFHPSEMAEVTIVELHRPLMTPELLEAAIKGDEQVLTEMLGLEEGCDDQVNVTIDAGPEIEQHNHLQSATFMGNTVLHVLCSNDHDALAAKICNKDTSLLKARNKMLETPLHCAAKGGCTRTVSTLLKFGAEAMVRGRNCHGETALHEAARHHHKGVVDELMTVDPELAYEVDNYGVFALEVALARGNTEMMEKLSEQSINSRICSSRPDHHNYMENIGNAQKPINMSTVDILGISPIHLVASVGNTNGAKLLLQNDASLAYLRDSDGLFPIHVAARMGHVEMVILFMQRYLDSGELLDHCGRNFLHIAAKENKFNIFIKLFIKLCIKFNAGKLPRWIEKFNAYQLPSCLIEKFNDNGLPPLWEGMLTRMINSVDNNGNTPLHLAAEKGGQLVETLIKIDEVDQDIRNRRGLTPFDLLVIQVKESTQNSLDLADQIEKYVQKKGARITSGWFDKFMYPTGSSNEKKGTNNFISKLQIIGLGAVLIATVAFATPFALQIGDMKSSSSSRKYIFKAFMFADTCAFVNSFFCTVMLMYGGVSSINPDANGMFFSLTLFFFIFGARCLLLAFGLGMYLLLSPISTLFGNLILAFVFLFFFLDVTAQFSFRFVSIIEGFKKKIEDIFPKSDIYFHIIKFGIQMLSLILPYVILIWSFILISSDSVNLGMKLNHVEHSGSLKVR